MAEKDLPDEDISKVLPANYDNGTRSSYGVLAVDAEGKEDAIKATLEWILQAAKTSSLLEIMKSPAKKQKTNSGRAEV